MLEVIPSKGGKNSRILCKIFKNALFFFCIQHILQANDLVNVLASGLSLSCELTFCPYKASQDGGSWRKLSVKGSFHIKMTF